MHTYHRTFKAEDLKILLGVKINRLSHHCGENYFEFKRMSHTYQLCEYLFQMLRGEQAFVKQQVPTLFHTLAGQDQQLMGRIVGQQSPHLQVVTCKHQHFSSNSSFLCTTYSQSSEDEIKIHFCNKRLQKKRRQDLSPHLRMNLLLRWTDQHLSVKNSGAVAQTLVP